MDKEGKLLGIVTRGDIVSSVYEAFWSDYEPEVPAYDDQFEDFDKVSDAISQTHQNGGDSE